MILCMLMNGWLPHLGAAERDQDWPCFLGPHGNNTSTEQGLTDRWPEDGPPIVWERKIGTGYSAPSIHGQTLVLHHRRGNEEVVEALDTSTGKTRWQHLHPTTFVDPYGYNNGPRSTPTLTSNRCYTFGAQGLLLCLDVQDGSVVWQRDSANDWNVPEAFFGIGSSPLLLGDRLIVMVGGQPNSGVVALHAETGVTLWESVGRETWDGVIPISWRTSKPYDWKGTEKLTSYSSPIAATLQGKTHVLCLMRQGLVLLDPENGRVRFKRWFSAQVNESVNAMTPVVHGDQVFLSSAYDRLGSVLLRVNPDDQSLDDIWRSPTTPFARDPETKKFEDPVLEAHWNTPVLHKNHLYAFSGRNEPDASFRCVAFGTGRLKWTRKEGWRRGGRRPPDEYGRGSVILADGKLIVLGEGGKLGLFRPDATRPVELCSWQVPSLEHPIWAGPVLSRGRLYLRSENRLVCIDLRVNDGS